MGYPRVAQALLGVRALEDGHRAAVGRQSRGDLSLDPDRPARARAERDGVGAPARVPRDEARALPAADSGAIGDLPGAVGRPVVRRMPRRGLRRGLQSAQSLRGAHPTAARAGASRAVRDPARPASAVRFRRGPLPLGQTLRAPRGARLLAGAGRRVRGAPDRAHGDAGPRAGLRSLRRRAPRDPLRSDEERDRRGPPPRRRTAARESRVPPLRRPLGLPDPRVSPLPGEDQGQSGAARGLPPREFPLWPDLSGRCRPRRSVRPLAGPCQSARAWHHACRPPESDGGGAGGPFAPRRPAVPLPGAGAPARGPDPPGADAPGRGRAPLVGELCPAPPGGRLMPTPTLRDRLRAQLADLKMPGALEALDDILRRADSGELAAGEAMTELLGSHIALRNQRRLQTAMRSARLPAVKTLADFDFTFQPSVKRDQLESLHTLSFIERRENVVFLGPPGVGKTHLAVSLAVAAAEGGRRVYYATLADLITSLEDAQQAGRLSHRLRTLVFPSLMIIDEIGYLPLSRTGAMLFFQLMSRRYEHASTVLTSNKGFEDWGEVFGDDVMAAALIDRLLHHCHIVNIRGNSYRMREHRALATRLTTTPAKSPPPRARRPSRQEA